MFKMNCYAQYHLTTNARRDRTVALACPFTSEPMLSPREFPFCGNSDQVPRDPPAKRLVAKCDELEVMPICCLRHSGAT